jgi:CheY-like chemotaxis protein
MKILVADDDEVFTSLIEGCLSSHHDVTAVHDGNDVVTAFIDGHRLNEPYDVILLDISLPNMTGDKILQRIRKHEKRHFFGENRVYIAITSGYSNTNVIRQSISDGCDHYYIKPIHIEQITDKLNSIVPQMISHRVDYSAITLKP